MKILPGLGNRLTLRDALHNNQSKLHHPKRNMLLESSNKSCSVNSELVLSAVSQSLSANSEFILVKCPQKNLATQFS